MHKGSSSKQSCQSRSVHTAPKKDTVACEVTDNTYLGFFDIFKPLHGIFHAVHVQLRHLDGGLWAQARTGLTPLCHGNTATQGKKTIKRYTRVSGKPLQRLQSVSADAGRCQRSTEECGSHSVRTPSPRSNGRVSKVMAFLCAVVRCTWGSALCSGLSASTGATSKFGFCMSGHRCQKGAVTKGIYHASAVTLAWFETCTFTS